MNNRADMRPVLVHSNESEYCVELVERYQLDFEYKQQNQLSHG